MRRAQTINTHEIDLRVFSWPLPVNKVSKYMETLNSGNVLKVSARGKSTLQALAVLCSKTGDQLVEYINNDNELTFYIRKT